jgi:lipopolysaccharide/colanic/teichoic acid biosynthesis glycosyltransferase
MDVTLAEQILPAVEAESSLQNGTLRDQFVGAQRAATIGRTLNGAAIRVLDVLVSASLLIVLAPLYLIVAIVIRRDSGGPVIFRQQRVGKDMTPFSLLKFRTMRPDASDAPHKAYVEALMKSDEASTNGNLYKLTVDPRITRVGRVLRSWSLDELPQLVNVLAGQMSLVGPRPVIEYELELYPREYLTRFLVKPGLTGLWQVSGRNERTYHEMVQFDLQFVERQSLRLYLVILLKTIPVVLARRGVA